MAWSSPTQWDLGDVPPHTNLNQDLIASPLTIRSLNDVSCRVYRSSDLTIPNNTRQPVTWQNTIWNYGSIWSGGNATRITVPTTGIYLLTAKVSWANNSSGRRGIGYKVNGVAVDYDMQFQSAQSGSSRENGSDLISLVAGDYVEVTVFQSSGGNLDAFSSSVGASTAATLTLIATGTTAPIWTDPWPWSTGDILTSWRLNTQWHDNLLNLRASKGHAVKLTFADNLSISNGERGAISWDTPIFQIGSLWSSGSQLIAPVAGWYLLLATLEYGAEAAVTGAFRGVGYRVNDHSPNYDLQFQSGGAPGASTNGKALVRLEKNDVLEIYGFHDSDQSLTLNGREDRTRVAVCLMAA